MSKPKDPAKTESDDYYFRSKELIPYFPTDDSLFDLEPYCKLIGAKRIPQDPQLNVRFFARIMKLPLELRHCIYDQAGLSYNPQRVLLKEGDSLIGWSLTHRPHIKLKPCTQIFHTLRRPRFSRQHFLGNARRYKPGYDYWTESREAYERISLRGKLPSCFRTHYMLMIRFVYTLAFYEGFHFDPETSSWDAPDRKSCVLTDFLKWFWRNFGLKFGGKNDWGKFSDTPGTLLAPGRYDRLENLSIHVQMTMLSIYKSYSYETPPNSGSTQPNVREVCYTVCRLFRNVQNFVLFVDMRFDSSWKTQLRIGPEDFGRPFGFWVSGIQLLPIKRSFRVHVRLSYDCPDEDTDIVGCTETKLERMSVSDRESFAKVQGDLEKALTLIMMPYSLLNGAANDVMNGLLDELGFRERFRELYGTDYHGLQL